MSKLSYPKLVDYKVVCFHYNPLKNKDVVSLQVPNSDFTDNNTYSLRLSNGYDTQYITSLKNGFNLYDLIRMYGTVAYMPKTGECKVLEEENASATTRFNSVVRGIERIYKGTARRSDTSNRKISALWNQKPQR